MTLTRSFVLTRWDRPLTELAVNAGLGAAVPDPELSWRRADGWQCLAPDGWLWFHQLVPPVEAVEEEVGGPALGIGADGFQHVRIAFRHDGRSRLIAWGDSSTGSFEHWRDRMVQEWGENWRAEAANALWRWAAASTTAPVSLMGICGVLWVWPLHWQTAVFDLLEVLGLGPDPATPAWWTVAVPGCRYAVRPRDLALGLHAPADAPGDDLVLAFVDEGVGIYDVRGGSWVCEPTPEYGLVRGRLGEELRARDWTETPNQPSEGAGPPPPWRGTRVTPPSDGSAADGYPGASRVTVDPDVFGESDVDGWNGWNTSPGFRVQSEDTQGAVDALRRAGNRFHLVDEVGDEITEDERYTTDLYTPNWVSGVTLYDVGAELVVDTKGDCSGPMGRAMIRILVEELESAGVTAHIAPVASEGTLLGEWELEAT
ncbi:hypothetical protein ACWFNE_02390 [Cellulomonas sp. NPDC055163]